MKVVAVSQRVDSYSDRNEKRDALDQRLCLWISQAGYLAVPVPNLFCSCLSDKRLLYKWLQRIAPGAIVLSGGNDIGEVPERDNTETDLLHYSKHMSLPVLGICRGMQMMGVWSKARLVSVSGHVRTRHRLNGLKPEWRSNVNSFHEIALAECPAGFVVTARAEDGVIEAMCHERLPWQGWMWHPEREEQFSVGDTLRLQSLFGC